MDNQRDGHLKGPVRPNEVDMRYIPQDLKKAYTYDIDVFNELKRAPKVAKVLPKGKKINQMKQELVDILRAEYSID